MYHIFFIHSSEHGHLGCIWVLAILTYDYLDQWNPKDNSQHFFPGSLGIVILVPLILCRETHYKKLNGEATCRCIHMLVNMWSLDFESWWPRHQTQSEGASRCVSPQPPKSSQLRLWIPWSREKLSLLDSSQIPNPQHSWI